MNYQVIAVCAKPRIASKSKIKKIIQSYFSLKKIIIVSAEWIKKILANNLSCYFIMTCTLAEPVKIAVMF